MSPRASTFVEKCLAGEARRDDVDDYVDLWHDGEGGSDTSLGEFLGFTGEEYKLWAEKPNALSLILNARREGRPLPDRGDIEEIRRLTSDDLSDEDVADLADWMRRSAKVPN